MPKRYQHCWRPATGDQYPSQVVCVDCESDIVETRGKVVTRRETLRSWHAVVYRGANGQRLRWKQAQGQTAGEFWYRMRQLCAKNTATWMFVSPAARVLSLLDFWTLLEAREIVPVGADRRNPKEGGDDEEKEKPGVVILEDPPTVVICHVAASGGILKVCDTANYGPGHDSWHGGAAERVRAVAEWVHNAVTVLRDNGLGSWRCTAGSQAVYSFRRRFDVAGLVCHNFTKILNLERDAYFGGRCEAYRIGTVEGPVYNLDVRSLYPSCAWFHDVPTVPYDYHDYGDEGIVTPADVPPMSIGDVTIETPVADYPVVAELSNGHPPRPVPVWLQPFAGHARGQVLYPVGRFRTVLCWPELQDALLHGRVKRVHRLATYHAASTLAPFMATWYSMLEQARRDGNVPIQQWIKRVMVALIGKLGETGKCWSEANQDPSHGPYSSWTEANGKGEVRRFRNVSWYTQEERVTAESAESIPAIAAWVTSLGRVRLLHLLRSAGRDNVYYCDTDSLLCNRAGYDALSLLGEVRESTIGYLRLLGQYRSALILGTKHYAVDDQYKCAGSPRGTLVSSGDGRHWWHSQKLGDSVVVRSAPQATAVLIDAARRNGYRHGRVLADGTVVPWEMGGTTDDE